MQHTAILVPGLGNGGGKIKFAVSNWEKRYNVLPIVHVADWNNKSIRFEKLLNDLLKKIDYVSGNSSNFSLIGCSAGASLCFNAFYLRKGKICKLVNICGRLREGKSVTPTLEQAGRNSPSFKESVLRCESGLDNLTKDDKHKIMTIRALYDEIVPSITTTVDGAKNIKVFSIGHMLTGALSLTLYSNKIADFIHAGHKIPHQGLKKNSKILQA